MISKGIKKKFTARVIALCALFAVMALCAAAYASYEKVQLGQRAYFTGETVTLKVFYGNSVLGPELNCSEVFPVTRTVPQMTVQGRAALTALLKGPTKEEEKRGYFTSGNKDTVIRSFEVRDGTAYVVFNEAFNNVTGPCAAAAVTAEITSTLTQFPEIQDVVISVGK